MTRSLPDPAPEAEWEVWYRDMFDRECPPSVDVRGRGLVSGLMELWARHLYETVRPGGGQGFSRFHLRWIERRTVHIDGSGPGASKLRQWLFGKKRSNLKGYVAEADGRLLGKVAVTHAKLILAGGSCKQILEAAQVAPDRQAFERELLNLAL